MLTHTSMLYSTTHAEGSSPCRYHELEWAEENHGDQLTEKSEPYIKVLSSSRQTGMHQSKVW